MEFVREHPNMVKYQYKVVFYFAHLIHNGIRSFFVLSGHFRNP